MPQLSRLALWFVGFSTLVLSSVAEATGYNMPIGVTPVSRDIYYLHMTIFYICVAIACVVFGIMFYSIVKFRRSKGAKAAHFHESTVVEVLWTIVPVIILVLMAIPATRVLRHMADTSVPALTLKITGYQWKWKYDYLDQGVSFFSNMSTPQAQRDGQEPKGRWYLLEVDHEVVLPVKQKIRFLMTSNDVIHSWWVPELGVKQDSIPGYIHESWAYIEKPGIYRGQCAELCGANHAFMPIVIRAVTPEEFQQWVATQNAARQSQTTASTKTFTLEELMQQGAASYDQTCAVCHKPDGTGMPPVFPALKGSKVTTGPLAEHLDIVLHGKAGTAMQAFGQQLDDATLAAIITYERNAWGNDAANQSANQATVVQPSDVAAAR